MPYQGDRASRQNNALPEWAHLRRAVDQIESRNFCGFCTNTDVIHNFQWVFAHKPTENCGFRFTKSIKSLKCVDIKGNRYTLNIVMFPLFGWKNLLMNYYDLKNTAHGIDFMIDTEFDLDRHDASLICDTFVSLESERLLKNYLENYNGPTLGPSELKSLGESLFFSTHRIGSTVQIPLSKDLLERIIEDGSAT